MNDGEKSQRGKKWLCVLLFILQGLDSKSVPVTPLAENVLTKLAVEVWEKDYFARKKFDAQRTWAATF